MGLHWYLVTGEDGGGKRQKRKLEPLLPQQNISALQAMWSGRRSCRAWMLPGRELHQSGKGQSAHGWPINFSS